jgi:uncharacterized OB-fold protein
VTSLAAKPLVDYLFFAKGEPKLMAHSCTSCGARSFSTKAACGRCGFPSFELVEASSVGTLQSFTIVYRAPPGVLTPFISAVVVLDGGGAVKANLRGVPVDPAYVRVGMKVSLTTFVVHPDIDGPEYVSFGFEPTENEDG